MIMMMMVITIIVVVVVAAYSKYRHKTVCAYREALFILLLSQA